MSNWYYDEPADELAEYNRRVVYTEDMIVLSHRAEFVADTDVPEDVDELFVREQVIADWLICCWASPTDMPAGVYITVARPPIHL